jgi:hypothetical protein
MSKLSDAIRRTLRAEAAPMGFGAARSAPKATMLVGLLQSGAAGAAGADLLLLDGRTSTPSAEEVEEAKEGNSGAVVGLLAGQVQRETLSELRSRGLDFVVFDAEKTPASALLEEDVGFVLALPDKAEDEFMRSLDSLQLDAVYIEDLPSPLTVASGLRLMRSRRPIIARVSSAAGNAELETLRASGVAVVLTEDSSAVEMLKQAVLALPPRRVRREERPTVAVPRTAVQQEQHEEEEDD